VLVPGGAAVRDQFVSPAAGGDPARAPDGAWGPDPQLLREVDALLHSNANANAVEDQAGLVIGAVDPMSGCLGVSSTPGPPDQGASFGALPPELGDPGEG
jgi:hypothetical protein